MWLFDWLCSKRKSEIEEVPKFEAEFELDGKIPTANQAISMIGNFQISRTDKANQLYNKYKNTLEKLILERISDQFEHPELMADYQTSGIKISIETKPFHRISLDKDSQILTELYNESHSKKVYVNLIYIKVIEELIKPILVSNGYQVEVIDRIGWIVIKLTIPTQGDK